MAQCQTPITRKHETNIYTLPCGKCPNCYKRRISNWSFRLMEEDKKSSSSLFITLTYDTLKVPITEKGFMNLSKRDIQLFMKRLRKANRNKLKYFIAGEYGGKTERPHYHLILFNANIETIQKAWDNGQVHYGQVTGASVGYTLKYMMKVSKIPKHKNDDRQKEFQLCSKGLGLSYITDSTINWHKADPEQRLYLNLTDGKKISMPRYYKDKIFTRDERLQQKAYWTEKIFQELEEMAYKPNIATILRDKKESIKQQYKKMQLDSLTRKN